MPNTTELVEIAETIAGLYESLSDAEESNPAMERVLDGLFETIESIEVVTGIVGPRAREVLGPKDLDW